MTCTRHSLSLQSLSCIGFIRFYPFYVDLACFFLKMSSRLHISENVPSMGQIGMTKEKNTHNSSHFEKVTPVSLIGIKKLSLLAITKNSEKYPLFLENKNIKYSIQKFSAEKFF